MSLTTTLSSTWYQLLVNAWEKQPHVLKSEEDLKCLWEATKAAPDPIKPLLSLVATPFSAIIAAVKKDDDEIVVVALHNFWASPPPSIGVEANTKFFALMGVQDRRATKPVLIS